MPLGVSHSLLRLLALGLLGLTGVSVNAQCTDVHVVFARGSTEPQGLGICGKPLVSGITSNLQGKTVSSHAVVYGALASQTSAGPGATAMTRHVVQYAAQCPNAVFVLGGYSQGGSVTDIAIGIKTMLGTGERIPTELAPRIKAVVVFGNPLKLTGQTIPQASPLYGAKAIEYCNRGDPVCGGGANMMAHLTYASDGSVTKAAQRAAQLVGSGGGSGDAAQAAVTAKPGQATMPAPAVAPAPAPAPAIATPDQAATPTAAPALPSSPATPSSGGGFGGISKLINKGDASTKGSGLSGLFGGGGGASALSGLSGGGGLSGRFSGDSSTRSLPSYNFGNLRGSE